MKAFIERIQSELRDAGTDLRNAKYLPYSEQKVREMGWATGRIHAYQQVLLALQNPLTFYLATGMSQHDYRLVDIFSFSADKHKVEEVMAWNSTAPMTNTSDDAPYYENAEIHTIHLNLSNLCKPS